MNCNRTWIFLLVIQLFYVTPRPLEGNTAGHDTGQELPHHTDNTNNEHKSKANDEQVISVRITSSIAIGRGKGKSTQITNANDEPKTEFGLQQLTTSTSSYINENEDKGVSNSPPNLEGANIEFIKQLHAKKENKDSNAPIQDQMHPFQLKMYQINNETEYDNEKNDYELTKHDDEYQNADNIPIPDDNIPASSQDVDYYKGIDKFDSSILQDALKYSNERLTSNTTDDLLTKAESNTVPEVGTSSPDSAQTSYNSETYTNSTDDSIAEPSVKSVLEISDKNNENYENIENVPLARSVLQSPSSKNFIQGLTNKPPSERESSSRLTTVSFNVVHDTPKIQANSYSDTTNLYTNPSHSYQQQKMFYETPKIYSQPAQIYSEPAKFYSEPAKIYSEPAKIYSEPAKIYGEPAKIYSEPAKFYSEPASLHLELNQPNYTPWQQHSQPPSTTIFNTTPITTITISDLRNTHRIPEHQTEKNYEVDEKDSVLTDGRSHGVQESTTEKCKQDSCKVGYVVKGRQYNKYRVEERTSDGFIVGEYGVVRNEDGALRGVRYTADSDASPRLIYDALMKFLQLK